MTNENLVTIDIDDDDSHPDASTEMSHQQTSQQGISLIPEVCVYENQQLLHEHDESETLLNEHQPLLDHHDHFQSITYNQFPGMSTCGSSQYQISTFVAWTHRPRTCRWLFRLIVLPYLKVSHINFATICWVYLVCIFSTVQRLRLWLTYFISHTSQ